MSKTPEAYRRLISNLRLQLTSRSTTLSLAELTVPDFQTMQQIKLSNLQKLNQLFSDLNASIDANIATIDTEDHLLQKDRPTRQSSAFMEQLQELKVQNMSQKRNCGHFMTLLGMAEAAKVLDQDVNMAGPQDTEEEGDGSNMTLPYRGLGAG